MMKHDKQDGMITEQAALYALGILSQHETRAFESHLEEGCEVCGAELRSFDAALAALAVEVPAEAPPPRARETLLARLNAETTGSQNFSEVAEPFTIRAAEGDWQPVAEGVLVKRLFVNDQQGTVTTLVRLLPGAIIPRHRHRGVEQCLVLEGDLSVAETALGAGDYHCAPAGSVHEPLRSAGGATLLIIAPEHYEVLEGR